MIDIKMIVLFVVLEVFVINLALEINSLIKQHKLKKEIHAIVIEKIQNEYERELSLLEEDEQEDE